MSLRRQRISESVYQRFITLTVQFPIHVDEDQKLGDVAALAARRKLTIYDATYVELAKRRNIPLATLIKP
ncbi:MAG: type II toxin-antitoxin system VapC family toxin [Caldilineaceae bacterium]